MSFNRSLWKLVGRQIGREARAAMNTGNAFSTFWAPDINLARDSWLPLMTTVQYAHFRYLHRNHVTCISVDLRQHVPGECE